MTGKPGGRRRTPDLRRTPRWRHGRQPPPITTSGRAARLEISVETRPKHVNGQPKISGPGLVEIVRPGSSQAHYAAKSQQTTDLGEKKYRPLVRNFHARQPLTASGELYLIAVITTLHAGCQRRVRP